MAVSETDADPVTIALNDVVEPDADGRTPFPDEVTVDVTITQTGLDVARNGQTFVVERDGSGYSLVGVVGYERLPERIPSWLESVVELFGVDEVTYGR